MEVVLPAPVGPDHRIRPAVLLKDNKYLRSSTGKPKEEKAVEGIYGQTQLPVFFKCQNITVGIHSGFLDTVERDKLIPDFIARIAEHQDDLLRAFRDAAQADREAVP